MTDVDPIVGPGHTDELVFLVPDDAPPYTVRVTYEQVNPGTDGAVQLPWVSDTGKWWTPINLLTDEQEAQKVTEDEFDAAVNAYGNERAQLVLSTRSALYRAGLDVDQVNLLLEGK
ncbi:hypothetical protein SEA_SOOS_56 [Gordonia phage Soos]|nr:hypothetical protein SEA_SOOS_56 [Gordonia phage Soos]